MPDHARPHLAPSGAWPENFTRHRRGTNCPMCANDFAADDIGWGLLVRRGEVSNSYLWRSGQVRGYAVVIYTGRHVAEPTELDEGGRPRSGATSSPWAAAWRRSTSR
ncbi:hypothetical protein [Streptomyces sp. NPDC004658]|uniref:hypothetical protein n=1 Tax=Streptomyces sp. NPDC004658 TaxID=3154672 RepID=UPI00339E2A94